MTESAENEIELSIVAPVYNERENVRPLVKELTKALGRIGRPYEILLVDDVSTDGSLAAMERLKPDFPHLRILSLNNHAGQSAAMACGFQKARGQWVITIDADLQNDPKDIPKLLERTKEHELVVGWRKDRQDSWWRKVCSRGANRIRNALNGESIHDTGCSLKVMRQDIAVQLPVFNGMHRFIPTLARLVGASVDEVVVNHRPRVAGVSKYGFWNRAWRGLQDVRGVNWLKKRWVDTAATEH